MTKQITLEEALKLVSFYQVAGGDWQVLEVNGNVNGDVLGYVNGNVNGNVNGDVLGNVDGDVLGNVNGDVNGDVDGDVNGDVDGYVNGNVNGDVLGTINGLEWKFIETPKDKLQRLITELGNQELIDTFNQMKNN
jgi:hypothetical protein